MSGGYFDYKQYILDDIADQIENLVINNRDQRPDEWGGTKGRNYDDATICHFIDAVVAIRKAAAYANRIDYLLSGDDGEESFINRLNEELSHKSATPTANGGDGQ